MEELSKNIFKKNEQILNAQIEEIIYKNYKKEKTKIFKEQNILQKTTLQMPNINKTGLNYINYDKKIIQFRNI